MFNVFRRKKRLSPETDPSTVAKLLSEKLTKSGTDLATLSKIKPVLVVFLRHAGCTFCHEAVADISKVRQAIEASGTSIVIVHFGNEVAATKLLAQHGLQNIETIYDSNQLLYEAFGLKRGTLGQVASPKVIWRGLRAGLFDGHGIGRKQGDILQLPGVFLLDDCQVVNSFRHKTAADRPNYVAVSCRLN